MKEDIPLELVKIRSSSVVDEIENPWEWVWIGRIP
jgi:hypothetical protein